MTAYNGFGSSAPAAAYPADNNPITVATGFVTSLTGQSCTGVRIWIDSQATGQNLSISIYHAHLWSTGTNGYPETELAVKGNPVLVAGWNEITFDTPVAVDANTVYYVGVGLAGLMYSAISSYFADADIPAPSGAAGLTFPQDTADHHNGVYFYGDEGIPDGGFNSTFYGVDVMLDGASTSGQTVTAVPAQVTVAMLAPTLTTPTGQTITAPVINIAVAMPTPKVGYPVIVSGGGPMAIDVTMPAPELVTATGDTVQATTMTVTVAMPTPTLTTLTGTTVEAPAMPITVTMPAPTISSATGSTVTPPAMTVAVAMPAPAVTSATGQTVNALAAAITVAMPAPTVTSHSGQTIAAPAMAVTVSMPAPRAVTNAVHIDITVTAADTRIRTLVTAAPTRADGITAGPTRADEVTAAATRTDWSAGPTRLQRGP